MHPQVLIDELEQQFPENPELVKRLINPPTPREQLRRIVESFKIPWEELSHIEDNRILAQTVLGAIQDFPEVFQEQQLLHLIQLHPLVCLAQVWTKGLMMGPDEVKLWLINRTRELTLQEWLECTTQVLLMF